MNRTLTRGGSCRRSIPNFADFQTVHENNLLHQFDAGYRALVVHGEYARGVSTWRRPAANPPNDTAASADVLVCQVVGRLQHNQRSLKMMNTGGWMSGGMGGGMWIWTVIVVLVVVLLVVAISKMSKK